MKGCNNLNELKTVYFIKFNIKFLEETDYGSFLQSNENQELTIPALRTKLKVIFQFKNKGKTSRRI